MPIDTDEEKDKIAHTQREMTATGYDQAYAANK